MKTTVATYTRRKDGSEVEVRAFLPPLDRGPAPAGFTYCTLCRGYQHPKWHDPAWRHEQRIAGTNLGRTYAEAPT